MSLAGMSRLIELCRSPSERNSSDAVLVACLVSSQPLLPSWALGLQTRGSGYATVDLGSGNLFWVSPFLFKMVARIIPVSLSL